MHTRARTLLAVLLSSGVEGFASSPSGRGRLWILGDSQLDEGTFGFKPTMQTSLPGGGCQGNDNSTCGPDTLGTLIGRLLGERLLNFYHINASTGTHLRAHASRAEANAFAGAGALVNCSYTSPRATTCIPEQFADKIAFSGPFMAGEIVLVNGGINDLQYGYGARSIEMVAPVTDPSHYTRVLARSSRRWRRM